MARNRKINQLLIKAILEQEQARIELNEVYQGIEILKRGDFETFDFALNHRDEYEEKLQEASLDDTQDELVVLKDTEVIDVTIDEVEESIDQLDAEQSGHLLVSILDERGDSLIERGTLVNEDIEIIRKAAGEDKIIELSPKMEKVVMEYYLSRLMPDYSVEVALAKATLLTELIKLNTSLQLKGEDDESIDEIIGGIEANVDKYLDYGRELPLTSFFPTNRNGNFEVRFGGEIGNGLIIKLKRGEDAELYLNIIDRKKAVPESSQYFVDSNPSLELCLEQFDKVSNDKDFVEYALSTEQRELEQKEREKYIHNKPGSRSDDSEDVIDIESYRAGFSQSTKILISIAFVFLLGFLLIQAPKAGENVASKDLVMIEDFTGKDAQLVKKSLEDKGVEVQMIELIDEWTAPGNIIKMDASVGSYVPKGSTVTLYYVAEEEALAFKDLELLFPVDSKGFLFEIEKQDNDAVIKATSTLTRQVREVDVFVAFYSSNDELLGSRRYNHKGLVNPEESFIIDSIRPLNGSAKATVNKVEIVQ